MTEIVIYYQTSINEELYLYCTINSIALFFSITDIQKKKIKRLRLRFILHLHDFSKSYSSVHQYSPNISVLQICRLI